MKVDFNDCEFGCFEPHRDIIYNGKPYRAIDVEITLDDGTKETHTIAECQLERELYRDFKDDLDDSALDNEISYYADNNDGFISSLNRLQERKSLDNRL